MGESLTQRRRVGEEGLRVVNPFSQGRTMTVPEEEVSANYVPAASVKKTGRLVIFTEERKTGGFAAEVAAIVADEAFDYLDGPIKRVTDENELVKVVNKLVG